MLGDETRGAFCRSPERAKPAPGALLYALALVLIVNLRELLPAVGQTKPKLSVVTPRLRRQLATSRRLVSIFLVRLPNRGLALLYERDIARLAFKNTNIR